MPIYTKNQLDPYICSCFDTKYQRVTVTEAHTDIDTRRQLSPSLAEPRAGENWAYPVYKFILVEDISTAVAFSNFLK